MKKVFVVGTCGSGKSTFSHKLSKICHLPFYEIDDYYWLPNWEMNSPENIFRAVSKIVLSDEWIIAGNNSGVRDFSWPKADVIIWLDYPFLVCFWGVWMRMWSNIRHKVPICNGNYESFKRAFFSRDSILYWVLSSYRRRKKNYLRLMEDPKFAHVKFIRFRSRKQAANWLASLDVTS